MKFYAVKKYFKIGDVIVFGLALFFTFTFVFLAYTKLSGAEVQVFIEAEHKHTKREQWLFPLATSNETIAVAGRLGGDTVIRIEQGRVWVVSSPCDNQLCVLAGKVSAVGSWVACLPNGVFFTLEATKNQNNASQFDVMAI
jgi:hypothetical protein